MQTSQKRVARLIHSAQGSKSIRLERAIRRKLIWIFVLGITALCLQLPVGYCSFAQARNSNGIDSSPIRLVLQIPKKRYRVDEPVEVLGYLENRGENSFYVGNALLGFFVTSELHEIKLRIFDEKSKEVWVGGGGGSWIWTYGTTINEKLALAYTQLRPETIFGVKERIPVTLRPGQYRLTATYREMEALSWAEADRKALPIQVWTQPLTSNTVTIIVVP